MKDIHFKYPDSDQKRGQILEKETITKKESSRKMKIDEYTHDFQLTYGSYNKKLASESLKQSRNVDNNIRKHKENKLLCEKQNFNYYRDGGIGKVSISWLLNQDPNKLSYGNEALIKDPKPMDYWKTNFEFIQVDKRTESVSPVSSPLKCTYWYLVEKSLTYYGEAINTKWQ